MVKTIRRRSALVPLLLVLNACGGSAEAPRSPSSPPAERSRPAATDEADSTSVETTEPADAVTEPPQTASEAEPPSRLAEELEKRREAAKAQTGADEKNEAPIPKEEDTPPASAYTGPDPCRATSFTVDRVREACAGGGRAAAKRVMKDAITKAIAMSHSLKCADCHEDQKDYELKPNAVAELKRWLESS